jgi:hypothetical protein
MSETETRFNNIELEKLALEKKKVDLEQAKLEVERQKAKYTAVGVAVPIVVIAATVMLGVWSQYRKGQDDFALKSAEILLQGDNPLTTQNKAKALATLFPSQLPRDFAKSFDPDAFAHTEPDRLTPRRDLVNLMAAHPADAERILAIWKAMFPSDEWLPEFENQLRSTPSFQRPPAGRR